MTWKVSFLNKGTLKALYPYEMQEGYYVFYSRSLSNNRKEFGYLPMCFPDMDSATKLMLEIKAR